MINIPAQINAAPECTAIKIPNKVATPLPPLKPAKMGKICPSKAAMAKVNSKLINCCVPGRYLPDNQTNLTAKSPFNMSVINTGHPAFFPKTRKVLVAPAFPLPYSLTSTPYINCPIHTADGIDPIR